MFNSDELIGTTEHLTVKARSHAKQCCYNQVRLCVCVCVCVCVVSSYTLRFFHFGTHFIWLSDTF
jgi:hypothetical protein